MLTPVVVMSFSPLTQAFRAQLESLIGANAIYYNAADLRRMSLRAGMQSLRKVHAEKIIIAIENEAGRALIGPLSLAAALTRADSIEVIWPDLRVEAFRRAKAIGSLLLLARDTVRARRALSRSRGRMQALATAQP